MSRIFLNENAISLHIDSIISSKIIEETNIINWLNHNYYNFIKRKLKTKAVVKFDYDSLSDSEFFSTYGFSNELIAAYKNKQDIYRFKATDQLISDIEHSIDYLRSLKSGKDLSRFSVVDCFKHSKKWTEQLNKKTEIKSVNVKDLNVVHVFSNGYYIVRLVSKTDFEQEGKQMNHCVSGYYMDKYISGNEYKILSVRTPFHKPIATIEVIERNNKVTIQQFKGKSNRGMIDPKVAFFIKDYFYENFEYVNWYDQGAFGPRFNHPVMKKSIPLALWDDTPFNHLNLADQEISQLPDRLVVKGNLIIERTPITYLGENVFIGGDVFCEDSMLTVIHPNAKIGGILVSNKRNMIISYPDYLEIKI